MRDERHGRMHVRYCLTTSSCGGLDSHHSRAKFTGFLGQSRGHKPDAIGLTDATVDVVKAACTARRQPPPVCSNLRKACHPIFDEDLFDHVSNRIEAISVDSAENEVVSARDMSTPKPDGTPAPFRNCVHILRDAAHSARRLLSRLFKVDEVLDYTFQLFMLIASMIHWSDDLRKLYS
eukprot:2218393-Karenia_brevis.AAC.1